MTTAYAISFNESEGDFGTSRVFARWEDAIEFFTTALLSDLHQDSEGDPDYEKHGFIDVDLERRVGYWELGDPAQDDLWTTIQIAPVEFYG